MIKKLKRAYKEIIFNQQKIIQQSKENEWANIYHDSIRGVKHLEELPLNIGRWAGNYSFFFILKRIFDLYEPKRIIEFGLGESTKFISSIINTVDNVEKHIIIEHDEEWINNFKKHSNLSEVSEIILKDIDTIDFNEKKVTIYTGINNLISDEFDLYIIDGPFGSKGFSRIDILNFVSVFNQNTSFIILLDDFNRDGEKETVKLIINELNEKNISFIKGEYHGVKSQIIIAASNFKYLSTL